MSGLSPPACLTASSSALSDILGLPFPNATRALRISPVRASAGEKDTSFNSSLTRSRVTGPRSNEPAAIDIVASSPRARPHRNGNPPRETSGSTSSPKDGRSSALRRSAANTRAIESAATSNNRMTRSATSFRNGWVVGSGNERAAVDDYHGTGEPCPGARRQEDRGSRHVVGSPRATQRDAIGDFVRDRLVLEDEFRHAAGEQARS